MASRESIAAFMEPVEAAIMENKISQWLGLRDYYYDPVTGNGNDGAALVIVVGLSTLTLVVCWLGWKVLEWCLAGWSHQRMSRTVPEISGGWPILGQALELAKGAPWDVMTRWAMEYGSIYRFSLFGHTNVVLSDPAYMKEVMRNKIGVYHKDIDFAYKPFLSLLGTGIVTSDGQKWRKQRNKVSAAFRIEVLSEVPGMSQRAVERLGNKLDAAALTGESIEIGEELRHLTLQVISEALLSLSAEEADGTFATVYMPIVVEGHKRTWNPLRRFCPFLPAWWAHIKNQRILNEYITGIIVRRWDLLQRENNISSMSRSSTPENFRVDNGVNGYSACGNVNGSGGDTKAAPTDNGELSSVGSMGAGAASGRVSTGRRRDILDKVLASLEPDEWGQAAILQIRDEMKTFVLAGHETSASMLNWSLYELISDASLMKKVVEESEAVFGPRASLTGPLPSVEELRGLQFTEACLRESLRKYSVVPVVVRRSIANTTICGPAGEEHYIPKGASVYLMIKGVHERPDIWPEPLRYIPSRFLEPVAPYTFLPFIDGPRNCLGQHLSLLESKVVLSLMVNRYEFSLVNINASVPNPWIIPTISLHGTHLTVKRR